jgi:hypothetical protein
MGIVPSSQNQTRTFSHHLWTRRRTPCCVRAEQTYHSHDISHSIRFGPGCPGRPGAFDRIVLPCCTLARRLDVLTIVVSAGTVVGVCASCHIYTARGTSTKSICLPYQRQARKDQAQPREYAQVQDGWPKGYQSSKAHEEGAFFFGTSIGSRVHCQVLSYRPCTGLLNGG